MKICNQCSSEFENVNELKKHVRNLHQNTVTLNNNNQNGKYLVS